MSPPVHRLTFVLLLLGLEQVVPDAVPWTYHYDSDNGPDKWATLYQHCSRDMQSPIDIKTKDVRYSPLLKYFNLAAYNNIQGVTMELVNKAGHTAEVMIGGPAIEITQGGLPAAFTLNQFHFHWGADDTQGSEHSVDGKTYSMEMHLVHYNKNDGNISVAASQPFGLAVLGFFFEVGAENANFQKLLRYFNQIANPDDQVIIETFAVADLLPKTENLDFYRYSGSLTTPPCYESVIWSLATEPIIISEEQLNVFRALRENQHNALVNDFRPTQALHSREVTTTDSKYSSGSTTRPAWQAVLLVAIATWLGLSCHV